MATMLRDNDFSNGNPGMLFATVATASPRGFGIRHDSNSDMTSNLITQLLVDELFNVQFYTINIWWLVAWMASWIETLDTGSWEKSG